MHTADQYEIGKEVINTTDGNDMCLQFNKLAATKEEWMSLLPLSPYDLEEKNVQVYLRNCGKEDRAAIEPGFMICLRGIGRPEPL